jgi:hypothetical protein
LRGDYAEYFASTDKGYITNELWDSVVGHFLNTITPLRKVVAAPSPDRATTEIPSQMVH